MVYSTTKSGCTRCNIIIKILLLFVLSTFFDRVNVVGWKPKPKNKLHEKLGTDELDKAKKYIEELQNRMHTKLQPSSNTRSVTEGPAPESITKPDEWWQEQSIGKDKWSLGIAIVVENYSKYKLVQPTEHHVKGTYSVRPDEIYGGHYGIVALEQYNNYLQGSISWQIYFQEADTPVKKRDDENAWNTRIYGRRLNVAYYVPYKGSCKSNVGTRNGHSVHIIDNILEHNETTNSYKWMGEEGEKLQPRWHTKLHKPQHQHPQTYVEFEEQDSKTHQYRFLLHSHIYGNACRPTLKIQFFPGVGPLGETYVYDFSEPLKPKMSAPIKQDPTGAPVEMSMTKLFIYIASGVGFVAVALILGITCRKFIRKRKRDDKFRRPYDEPRVYRAGGSMTGENDGEDEE